MSTASRKSAGQKYSRQKFSGAAHPALHPGQRPQGRPCDRDGCAEEGVCRAPRSRDRLRDYYWFCKPHARDYNARWDYFADMDQDEIYAFARDSRTWHRPTWKMGAMPQGGGRLRDDLGIFDDPAGPGPHFTRPGPSDPGAGGRSAEEMQNLGILGLDETADMADIKRAYKMLVKKYHPDVNAGDEGAEETFKRICNAYQYFTGKK